MKTPLPNDDALRQAAQQWFAGLHPALIEPGELWVRLLDHLPDYIYVKDTAGHYVLDNQAHRRFLGVTSLAEVVGKTVFDFFPPERADQYQDDDRAILESGQPLLNREEPVRDPSGQVHWVSTTKVPLRSPDDRLVGIACIGRDITKRKRIEDALAQERDLLNTLMETIPDLIYIKDLQSRFQRISRAQAQRFGLRDPAEAVGKTDFDYFGREHAQQAYDDEQQVIRTGQPMVGVEEKEVWPDGRVTWVSTTKAPLRDKDGRIIGTLGISRDITERKLVQQQLARYAEDLQTHTLQLEDELSMAREVQQAILPDRYPSFPGAARPEDSALQFCHRYHPTGAVGGDFFDVLALSDSRAGVILCDVMGHGVRAALVTAILRALVEEAMPVAGEPGLFLSQINRRLLSILKQTRMPMFASAFYLVADVAAGQVQYASAGHPSPFHVQRRAGQVELLTFPGGKTGPVLGLIEDTRYDSVTRPVATGDLMMLFTDGLYEVDGAAGEPYGRDRLLAAVRQRLARPAPRMFDELLAEIQQFAAGQQFSDDVCLVGIEVARLN